MHFGIGADLSRNVGQWFELRLCNSRHTPLDDKSSSDQRGQLGLELSIEHPV